MVSPLCPFAYVFAWERGIFSQPKLQNPNRMFLDTDDTVRQSNVDLYTSVLKQGREGQQNAPRMQEV